MCIVASQSIIFFFPYWFFCWHSFALKKIPPQLLEELSSVDRGVDSSVLPWKDEVILPSFLVLVVVVDVVVVVVFFFHWI